jgi:nucleotide-binding universal stress UspA family protein
MATRPVVVAVDGSGESLRAVEWAAMEARRHRAPLRIVSAPAMPSLMRTGRAALSQAGTLRDLAALAVGKATARSAEISPDLLVDADLLSGTPALAVAGSGSGALMLVVGARGAGDFAALLLGSVSRYAAMHAPCPVVVVREETSAVHREIAVGIRDPGDTGGTLAFAFEEAALRGAALVVVHCWYWFPSAFGASARGNSAELAQISAEASRNLTEALNGWREKYPAVPVRQDVVRGHPARVLACYSARADLVVIGRHGDPGAGPVIGAVQHAVLGHARGPVAVIPSAG